MNKIRYIFFADGADEPMEDGLFRQTIRHEHAVDAVCFASAEIIQQHADAIHIFEDDGENITPVLTVKRYEEPQHD